MRSESVVECRAPRIARERRNALSWNQDTQQRQRERVFHQTPHRGLAACTEQLITRMDDRHPHLGASSEAENPLSLVKLLCGG
jgi:hypothetical protein